MSISQQADRRQVREAIHRALNGGAGVLLQKHARERGLERGISFQDVLWVVNGGVMKGEPRHHALGFECIMRGTTADGVILEVPVIIDVKTDRVIVKTVIGKGRERRQ